VAELVCAALEKSCSDGDADKQSDSSWQQQLVAAGLHGSITEFFLAAVGVAVCQTSQTSSAFGTRVWGTGACHHLASQTAATHGFLTTNSNAPIISANSDANMLCNERLKVKSCLQLLMLAHLRTTATCHMGSHSVTCHPTHVNVPHLNPSQIGRYSIYIPWQFTCPQTVTHLSSNQLVATRPVVESATFLSLARHRTAMPEALARGIVRYRSVPSGAVRQLICKLYATHVTRVHLKIHLDIPITPSPTSVAISCHWAWYCTWQ